MTTLVFINKEKITEEIINNIGSISKERVESSSILEWTSPKRDAEDFRDYFNLAEAFLLKFCKDINVTAIVNTLDVTTFSPYNSSWSGLIAMLALAFPEVNWVFLTVEDSLTKDEKATAWMKKDFSTDKLVEIQGTPIFDNHGLRNWLRGRMKKDYEESAQDTIGDSNLDVQVRTKLAVVLDEEVDYSYFQALMAYGRGFRVYAIESWREALKILGSSSPDKSIELDLSIEDLYLNYPDQSDRNMSDLMEREKVLTALNLKTPICRRFVTVGHGVTGKESKNMNLKAYLDRRKEIEKSEIKISPKTKEQVVFKPVTGLYSHWNELGLKKVFVAQNEYFKRKGIKMNLVWIAILSLLILFCIGSFFLSFIVFFIFLIAILLYLLITYKLFKSENGLNSGSIWRGLGQKRLSWNGGIFCDEQGVKMDFVWPPTMKILPANIETKKPNQKGKPDHGTPGRILQIAQSLMKGINIMDGEDTLRTAVCKAVRATDALELLMGRTPMLSIEALSLKHYYEVFVECQFIGVEYRLSMYDRLYDIRTNILFLAKWINPSRNKAFILNGEAGILSGIIGILDKNGRFEETEVFRTRLSSLRRKIEHLSDTKRRLFGVWRFPLWLVSSYIDFALRSLIHYTLVIFAGVLFFAIGFRILGHCWYYAIDYTIQAMITVSLPNSGNIWAQILSYFAAAFGIVNIGLLVAHIYSRIIRK